MKRTQYYECPLCGAHLDYGEKCDCKKEEQKKKESLGRYLKIEQNTRQVCFVFDGGDGGYERKSYC